jgi:hypothetical protein
MTPLSVNDDEQTMKAVTKQSHHRAAPILVQASPDQGLLLRPMLPPSQSHRSRLGAITV